MTGLGSFAGKLHCCCEKWASHGVSLTTAQPDARDLFDIARLAVQAIYREFIDFLAELLSAAMTNSKLKARPSSLHVTEPSPCMDLSMLPLMKQRCER